MPKPPPAKYLPRGISVLFEDSDLMIISKPEGLLSVPARYETDKNALSLMTQFFRKGQAKSKKNLFAVNRLDRETSGILIFAKSLEFRELLHSNWDSVEKFYIAVVAGTLPQDSGVIESYLVQDDDYRVHSTENESLGKLAKTRFDVIRRGDGFTTIRVQLLTGRKNQIRVHFSEAGHPLLGDKMYGRVPAKRLALHAAQVSFTHPFTRARICVESPLPDFFVRYMPLGEK